MPGGVVGEETAFSHHHARAVSSSLRTPRRHDAHVGRTAELSIMKHSCRRILAEGFLHKDEPRWGHSSHHSTLLVNCRKDGPGSPLSISGWTRQCPAPYNSTDNYDSGQPTSSFYNLVLDALNQHQRNSAAYCRYSLCSATHKASDLGLGWFYFLKTLNLWCCH